MSCHASTDLPAALPGFEFPDDRSMAASRGDDIHEMLAQVIGYGTRKDLGDIVKMLSYVNDIMSRRRFNVLTEHKMKMTWLQAGTKTTADVILYTQDELHVIDHKTGSIPVMPNCTQLLTYGAAAMRQGFSPKAKGVYLHVNQPTGDNQVSYFALNEELEQLIAEQTRHEAEILAGDLSFGPSDAACLFCPASPFKFGVKANITCEVATPPKRVLSAADQTYLSQRQSHTMTGARRDDPL